MMENWEFLLQKEGDRSWLPLESPDVEILEGQYRVVARSNWANAPVEVRVTHLSTEEVPPKRRMQKRLAATNADGLMVVFPFTNLQPGVWEIGCSGKSPSGAPWQQTVQLQVLTLDLADSTLAPDSEHIEAPAWTDAAGTDTPDPLRDLAVSLAMPDQPTAMTPFSPQEATSSSGTTSPESSVQKQAEAEQLQRLLATGQRFAMTLDQNTFAAQVGKTLLLSGQINLTSAESPQTQKLDKPLTPPRKTHSSAQDSTPTVSGELQICLRDPQTAQVLIDTRHPLPRQKPPLLFACALYVPPECQTRLILGEVVFSIQGVTFASQAFTIATPIPIEHLLAAIEEDFDRERHQAPPEPPPSQPTESVAASPTLSPQRHGPASQSSPHQSLQLPTFGNSLFGEGNDFLAFPKTVTFTDLVKGVTDATPGAVSGEETSADAAPETPISAITPEGLQSPNTPSAAAIKLPLPDAALAATDNANETPVILPESETTESTPNAPEALPVGSETEGLASRFRERFWSRLNDLAHDAELLEWLKFTEEDETGAASSDTPIIGAAASRQRGVTREVVVDYEPLEVPTRKRKTPQPAAASAAKITATKPTPSLIFFEDVPIPILEVLAREIIAGRQTKVRVQLPEIGSRLYVKIWVYDRQSQTIVDGPRWLTEFVPNGLGNVETVLDVEIPYGSLEIQFEAIAVEMQTQRESPKATVERLVVPPAAPRLPLDPR